MSSEDIDFLLFFLRKVHALANSRYNNSSITMSDFLKKGRFYEIVQTPSFFTNDKFNYVEKATNFIIDLYKREKFVFNPTVRVKTIRDEVLSMKIYEIDRFFYKVGREFISQTYNLLLDNEDNEYNGEEERNFGN